MTISLENQEQNKSSSKVEVISLAGYEGNSFGEKTTFTVGLSFLSCMIYLTNDKLSWSVWIL